MADSKRQLLFSTMLSASLLVGCATIDTPEDNVEESRYSDFIQTLESLCKDTTYIILGDSNHAAPEITEVVSDLDVLQAIKNCNRPFFQESGIEENEGYEEGATRPKSSRTLRMMYQDFQDGEVQYTGKEYLGSSDYDSSTDEQKNDQSRLRLIYNAAQLGVPLVYPDIRYEDIKEDVELSEAFEWVYDQYYAHNVEDVQGHINFMIALDAYFNKNLEARPSGAKLQRLFEASISEEANQGIVTNIIALGGGNPALIMYGAGHMGQNFDFDEMLGAQQTTTIYFKVDSDHVVWSDPIDAGTEDVVTDDPEFIYDIQNNNMVEVDKADPENAFQRMIKYGYTIEEYSIAVDSLPEDLKAYALPYSEYDDTAENDQLPKNWIETDIIYSSGNDPEL